MAMGSACPRMEPDSWHSVASAQKKFCNITIKILFAVPGKNPVWKRVCSNEERLHGREWAAMENLHRKT